MESIERTDRVSRFLSIWEEEGCNMIEMSCQAHDEYAANSQFITHLIGRVLAGNNNNNNITADGDREIEGLDNDPKGLNLKATPIDTKGFQSLLELIDNTTADSFDLFFGLYKYNSKNSQATIAKLQQSLHHVIQKLQTMEEQEQQQVQKQKQRP